PTLRGILVNHDSKAARTEFGKRIATSKDGSRRSNRTDEKRWGPSITMIASTSGTSFHIAAIFSGAATVTRASGRPLFIARTADTISAALVLLASNAGRGEVDASFPKKGVHSP